MSLSHSPSIVTTGLVFSMDPGNTKSYPGSGTTAYNLVNNGTHTLSGGITLSSGNFAVDGTGYIYSTTNGMLDTATTASIFGWCKKAATNNAMSFGVLKDSGSRAEFVWYTNGALYGEVGSDHNQWVSIAAPNNDTNWHYLGFTYDGNQSTNVTKITIYADGVQLNAVSSSGNIGTSISTTSMPVWIGRRNTGYSTGQIGPVHMYNTKLTAAQVKQNYNAMRSRYGL